MDAPFTVKTCRLGLRGQRGGNKQGEREPDFARLSHDESPLPRAHQGSHDGLQGTVTGVTSRARGRRFHANRVGAASDATTSATKSPRSLSGVFVVRTVRAF